MNALNDACATNASPANGFALTFHALIDALVSRWKPERQRVAPLSARSMALKGFRCPARDALMLSPYRGNASRPTRRLPAVRVSP